MADLKEDVVANQAGGQRQPPDLTIPETIKHLYETAKVNTGERWQERHALYKGILADVRSASPQELATAEFRRRLWIDNLVAGSGPDGFAMKDVVENDELAKWIGDVAKTSLPPRGPERIKVLEKIYGDLCESVNKTLKAGRTPWLRIGRVMAALFPEDYTGVPGKKYLREVGKAMFGKLPRDERESMTRLNARILDRLAEILGPTNGTCEQLALRGMFVWSLVMEISGGEARRGK